MRLRVIPMTGLGAQMGKFKHGIGTPQPFRFLTFEGKSSQELKSVLDSLNLAGLSFQIKSLKDGSGKESDGVYIVLSDWNKWRPYRISILHDETVRYVGKPQSFSVRKNRGYLI